MSALRAIVVVPAHDEALRIGACLDALAQQEGVAPESFEVLVVLDRCRDATAAIVAEHAAHAAFPVRAVAAVGEGVGAARRQGMELACRRLEAAGRGKDGLVATTDADSRVDPRWLAEQLALVDDGAQAIGGLVTLDGDEAREILPASLDRRAHRARARLHAVREDDPEAEHPYFSGSSMSVTVAAYRRVNGLEAHDALEDDAFGERLREAGVSVVRSARVRVSTSARTRGRAGRGLARDLELGEWLARRVFDGRGHDPARLAAQKGEETLTVLLPARNCEATLGGILEQVVLPAREAGLVDEILVLDGRSEDRTLEVARALGVDAVCDDDLLPEFGPGRGKGDAMWRGLAATTGSLIAFMDADTADPDPAHLLGTVAPLLDDPTLHLVKGSFTRPFRDRDGNERPAEGGRVTELMARPLINRHAPALAGFEQPLAGEMAGRRSLLEALPFPVGYGIEIAMMFDALAHVGLDGLAEAKLGTRRNRHQPLRDLGAMAYAVLHAVELRVMRDRAPVAAGLVEPWNGGIVRDVSVLERPPLARLTTRRASRL